MLSPLGNSLSVVLNNIKFEEGYAIQDGSALFIDATGKSLYFKCTNCSFNEIYSMNTGASAIAIK